MDATNHTRDSSVQTGDVEGVNDRDRQVWTIGFGDEHGDDEIDDVFDDDDDDDVEDDDEYNSVGISGDGIAGQVFGIVTSSGGTTDVVVANTSDDADLRTGDAETLHDAFSETGDAIGGQAGGIASAGDTSLDATNLSRDVDVRTGDAFSTFADAFTGDGIAGELIGIVTASTGSADVVLANTSQDDDVRTGDADAFFSAFAETGSGIAGQVVGVDAGGITSVDATNGSLDTDIRTGDAEAIEDDSVAITGDGVGGQVLGVVTAPGGRADLVTANLTEFVDLVTGDTFAGSIDLRFIGVPDVSDD